MSYKKVGGLHFFKLWRIQIAFCLLRKKPEPIARTQHFKRRIELHSIMASLCLTGAVLLGAAFIYALITITFLPG